MTEPTEPRKRGRPPGQTKPKSSTERNRAMRRRRINEETEAVGHEAEATTRALVAVLARTLPQADAGSGPARNSARRAWEALGVRYGFMPSQAPRQPPPAPRKGQEPGAWTRLVADHANEITDI